MKTQPRGRHVSATWTDDRADSSLAGRVLPGQGGFPLGRADSSLARRVPLGQGGFLLARADAMGYNWCMQV